MAEHRDPANAHPQAVEGLHLVLEGRAEEAEVAFRQALEADASDDLSQNGLGVALARQGRTEEAEAAYRQAIGLNPGEADYHLNLGDVLLQKKQLQEAEAAHRRAVELAPLSADAQGHLGESLMAEDRFPEAEKRFQRAIELEPEYGRWHACLAQALGCQDKPDEAEPPARRAVELSPDKPGYQKLLSIIETENRQTGTHSRSPEAGVMEQSLKVCPQCAEEVKAAARVCRYCGYRFGTAVELAKSGTVRGSAEADSPSAPSAPAKAGGGCGCFTVLVIIAAVLYFGFGIGRHHGSHPQQSQTVNLSSVTCAQMLPSKSTTASDALFNNAVNEEADQINDVTVSQQAIRDAVASTIPLVCGLAGPDHQNYRPFTPGFVDDVEKRLHLGSSSQTTP